MTERLLRLAPNRAETHLWAGETYRMIALGDAGLAAKLVEYKNSLAAKVEAAAAKLK